MSSSSESLPTGGGRVALAAATLLIPAVLLVSTAAIVLGAFSALPIHDQWTVVGHFARLEREPFGIDDLFAQHNEHRIALPRLVFLADLAFFRGSNQLNVAVNFAVLLVGALVYVRAAGALRLTVLRAVGLTAALSLCASLAHWQNLLWGLQVQFIAVFALGAWALMLFSESCIGREQLSRAKLAGALALLVATTLCMSNGVLVGAAMVLVGLAARASLTATATVATATALLALAYFTDYQTGAGQPLLAALAEPGRLAQYSAAYVGAVAGPAGLGAAIGLGAAGILAGCAAGAALLWRGGSARQWALVGFMAFVIGTAAVTALGRLSYGVEQALSQRYMTPSAFYWAALAVFWTGFADRRGVRTAVAASAALCAAVMLGVVLLQFSIPPLVAEWRRHAALGANVLLVGADDPAAIRLISADMQAVRLAPYLRARRLSIFADPAANQPGQPLAAAGRPVADACHGAFDLRDRAPEGGAAWRVAGWAVDAQTRRAPQRIVLTDADGRIVGMASLGEPRPDVLQALGEPRLGAVGWVGVARQTVGPLTAWGVLDGGRVCELGRK